MNFKDRNLKASDTGISYRVLNNWDNEGILPDSDAEKGHWRRFSHYELFWLRIVIALRGFGFSLKQILKIKEKLFEEIDDKPILYKAWFLYQWNKFWQTKENIILSVLEDCEIQLNYRYARTDKNHISINLTEILNDGAFDKIRETKKESV